MTASLLPERPLLIIPSLAATIGLEEATLVAAMDELTCALAPDVSGGYQWFQLPPDAVEQRLPFWDRHDISRISQSLRAQGLILLRSAPFAESNQFIFAFNVSQTGSSEPVREATPEPAVATSEPSMDGTTVGATAISPQWRPDSEVIARIRQHNISDDFIRSQIPEFVTYWRESGEHHRSWGAKFLQHVIYQWRQRERFQVRKDQEASIANDWRPSWDAMEVLTKHAGINAQFVEDAIPEFVLYWSERGEKSRTWNTKFIQHVRRQWARFASALEHDTEPRRIPENWQPNGDVMDILALANIDSQYAVSLVPEFVLFWRDSNQVYSSWNTKFLQHVKYHWARRHALPMTAGSTHEGQQRHPQSDRTKDRSIAEQLSDRSWAG